MTDSNCFTDDVRRNYIQNPLSSRDMELYEFTRICGITMDPVLFKTLVELLRLDVSPTAIFTVLQKMAELQLKSSSSKKSSLTKNGPVQTSSKKKPPVAAKPKKIRVENSEVIF